MSNLISIHTMDRAVHKLHEGGKLSDGADYRGSWLRAVAVFIADLFISCCTESIGNRTEREINDKRGKLEDCSEAIKQAIGRAEFNESSGLLSCSFEVAGHTFTLSQEYETEGLVAPKEGSFLILKDSGNPPKSKTIKNIDLVDLRTKIRDAPKEIQSTATAHPKSTLRDQEKRRAFQRSSPPLPTAPHSSSTQSASGKIVMQASKSSSDWIQDFTKEVSSSDVQAILEAGLQKISDDDDGTLGTWYIECDLSLKEGGQFKLSQEYIRTVSGSPLQPVSQLILEDITTQDQRPINNIDFLGLQKALRAQGKKSVESPKK